MNRAIAIGPALSGEAAAIESVLEANRDDPSVYLRGRRDIGRHIGEFMEAREGSGAAAGCASVHAFSEELAEIVSVVVLPGQQKSGSGALLIEECLSHARTAGYWHIFLATLKPGYFARFAFRCVARCEIPLRVLLSVILPVLWQKPERWLVASRREEVFMLGEL
jgi:N-acetylglutamate synthase-like GNAT family acetyltransferase